MGLGDHTIGGGVGGGYLSTRRHGTIYIYMYTHVLYICYIYIDICIFACIHIYIERKRETWCATPGTKCQNRYPLDLYF